jgi:hypothetical protein
VVANQQNVKVVARESHGLAVHLGDEWTGRIDRLQVSISSTLNHARRNAVSTENDVGALRHLIDLVDEDRALLFKGGDDVNVVNDLLAHVDRGTKIGERFFHRDDRSVDPGAIASRGRQEHPLVSGGRSIL